MQRGLKHDKINDVRLGEGVDTKTAQKQPIRDSVGDQYAPAIWRRHHYDDDVGMTILQFGCVSTET